MERRRRRRARGRCRRIRTRRHRPGALGRRVRVLQPARLPRRRRVAEHRRRPRAGHHGGLGSVPDDVARVTVGAAIEQATFGDLGALSVTVDSGATTIATAVLDAATSERSMIVAEVYRRRGVWRLRILGQGYDDDLAAFAVRHGVEVDG
nr:TerD family protein [Gordonia amarae]